MRAALILSLVAFAIAAPVSAAKAAAVDMCDPDPAAYAGDLDDNGFLAKLHERLVAGTVTCERQDLRRLGASGGRTYQLAQAWFTDSHDGPGSPATIAQVNEIDANGKVTVVFRESLIVYSDTFAAKLVEQDGKTILAVTTPVEHFFVRGGDGFTSIDAQWEIDDAQMAKALPAGDLLPTSGGREVGGDIFHFNLDTFSIDVPSAVASEVFPRTFADPDYDRPLTLRFPLVLKANQLIAGDGEVVEPDHYTPTGFGETPEFVSIPKAVQACEAYAWLEDDDPQGVAVHASPSTKGAVIATLPAAAKDGGEGAEVNVIGSIDDWFLIENAVHPAENYGEDVDPSPGTGSNLVRRTYRGRGWVHGSRLSTGIQSGQSLRASADPQSKAVFDLKLDPEGGESYVTITGFKSCKGEALDVDVKRSDGVTGTGWIGGDDTSQLCSSQVTTCS